MNKNQKKFTPNPKIENKTTKHTKQNQRNVIDPLKSLEGKYYTKDKILR